MTDGQENKLRMYNGVKRILTDFNSVWSGLVAFANNVAQFTGLVSSIEDKRREQETDTSGYTKARDKKKEEMANYALVIAGAVSAYASEIGDEVLGQQVNFTMRSFTYVRDSVSKSRAEMVRDSANGVLAQLSNYGVTQTEMNALQALITAFEDIIGRKSSAGEETQTATSELVELFYNADEILKDRLDKLMVRYKDTEPHFWRNYFNAREIIDLHGPGGGGQTPPTPTPTGVFKFDIDETVLADIFPKMAGNASATGVEQLNFDHGDGYETVYTLQNGILTGYTISFNTAGVYHAAVTEITPEAFKRIAVIQYDNCKLSGTLTIPPTVQATNIEVPMNPLLLAVDMQQESYANLVSFVVFGCGLLSINEHLIGLDNSGKLNGFANFSGGTNAAPSGLGIAAKNSLIAKGWTVITN